ATVGGEIQDRVSDELPRAVISHLPAAIALVYLDAEVAATLRREQDVRGRRVSTQSEDRLMLEEKKGLFAPLAHSPRCLALVLDGGCGAGSIVPALARQLADRGRYIGMDSHSPSIRWCRSAFRVDQRLRFEWVAAGAPCPAEDGAAGLVLVRSVFTHVREREARHLFQEIRRVLAPGRKAVVTA